MKIIRIILKHPTALTLTLIFILAIFLRFLYFPENIYFGYDQARDAFISRQILQGELKIVGPTTSIPGLSHGALFYYLYAPIYFISGSDPTGLAIFIRVYNALGVFLIFFISKFLFDNKSKLSGKWMGIISALLFAFSYEQTQYALFMTHPALAVITVLTFYLGMTLLLFQNKPYGLIFALLGLGLSFQFHFLLIFLVMVLALNLIIFRKRIPRLSLKIVVTAFSVFLFSISTFIVAEIRFNFITLKGLANILLHYQETGNPLGGLSNALLAASRYTHDNILAVDKAEPFILSIFLLISLYFLKSKELRDKIIFLLIWFIIGLISYFVIDTSLYFYGIGSSIALLIFISFLVVSTFYKSKILALILLVIVVSSNIYMILQNNPQGPNKEINVQTGMLLEDEKRVIDYIYSKSNGDPFAVNAFSMPLKVNTTWGYLFEWYGLKKYGYLPIWGGSSAPGYEGNLVVNNSRSTLPYKRFLIIEPVRGLEIAVHDFMTNESWFTDIIEEKHFGDFIVDFQKPK
jgi:4-amino-4-deoxy-L-arabinose transferase-like glycosyltransferase